MSLLKHFFPYLFAFFLVLSCSKSDSDEPDKTLSLGLPKISTTIVTNIAQTTSESGGNVTEDGGATIAERGVCWSTSAGPTISNNKTSDGSGKGEFSSSIADLETNTTYYLRAYATNSEGTAYGNEISFKTLEEEPAAKVFEGEVRLATQKEVNKFGKEDYNQIIGDVFIQGSPEDPIVDLSPLSSIEKVEGQFNIFNQTDLKNFDGLENLSLVKGRIVFSNNRVLEKISSLTGLESAKTIQILSNPMLVSLEGLQNIKLLDGLIIGSNNILENLNGLESLEDTKHGIVIVENNSLVDVKGLDKLKSIGGSLEFEKNKSLTEIKGFNDLGTIGGNLWVIDNNALISIEGFNNLKIADRGLRIYYNQNLERIIGLHNLEIKKTGSSNIVDNPNLKLIDILNNSSKIEGILRISGNSSLKTIEGFNNISEILNPPQFGFHDRVIQVYENFSLVNVPKFENLTKVEGSFHLYGEGPFDGLNKLKIVENNLTISGFETFNSLQNLTEVGGTLSLSRIEKMENLDILGNIKLVDSIKLEFLSSLIEIEGLSNISELSSLIIRNCESLTSLAGLDNLVQVESYFFIQNNPKLFNFCSLGKLVEENGLMGDYTVDGNGFNPLLDDLKAGICSN